MKRVVLLSALLSILSLPALAWTIPGDSGGTIRVPSNKDYPSSGTIRVLEEDRACTWADSCGLGVEFDLVYGNWKMPSCSVFFRDDTDPKKSITKGLASGFVEIWGPGNYGFAFNVKNGKPTDKSPLWAGWRETGVCSPLFGLPQVSQKGNNHPYADGKYTIAQRGCCLCSLLAWGKYLSGCPWDVDTFNKIMIKEGGYWVRDVIIPKAAWLLNLAYIGRFSYSKEILEKYKARGWATVVRVWAPGRDRNGNIKWHYHWVDNTPGVIQKNGSCFFGMMDPAERSNYFHQTRYRPNQIVILAPKSLLNSHDIFKIPYYMLKDRWWEDPNWISIPYWQKTQTTGTNVNLGLSLAGDESGDSQSFYSSGISRLDVISSNGVFITKVQTPSFILTKENSELVNELASLFDEASCEDDETHDDTLDWADLPEDPVEEPLPDHSVVGIGDAGKGEYTFYLSGAPNTEYQLRLYLTNENGEVSEVLISGKLDEKGQAVATLNFDPGVVVLQLGAMRQLSVGSSVTFLKEVTFSSEEEFFCEEADRSCGVRVISSLQPARGALVRVSGKVKAIEPELTIEADKVDTVAIQYPSIKPLGMPTLNWPQMANCLLAKIWGKVIRIQGDDVTIANGYGEVVVSGVKTPVGLGDLLTVTAVLRDSRILKAIPE